MFVYARKYIRDLRALVYFINFTRKIVQTTTVLIVELLNVTVRRQR